MKLHAGSLLAIALITASSFPVLASQNYMSQVSLVPGGTGSAVSADIDGTQGIVAPASQPFQAQVHYQIGWFTPKEGGGSIELDSSAVSDPEYDLLFNDSANNPSTLPPGLGFSSSTGLLAGTPAQPGVWKYQPAVRDKEKGESPYRGHGYWWTDYTTSNGHTWIESKTEVPIWILPAPTGKEVMLQCTGQLTAPGAQSAQADVLLQVNYEQGIAEIIGNDGKIAGAYHATVTDDFIAWGKTQTYQQPSIMAASVRVDRKTGSISAPSAYPNGFSLSGSCQKRSTEQKF